MLQVPSAGQASSSSVRLVDETPDFPAIAMTLIMGECIPSREVPGMAGDGIAQSGKSGLAPVGTAAGKAGAGGWAVTTEMSAGSGEIVEAARRNFVKTGRA